MLARSLERIAGKRSIEKLRGGKRREEKGREEDVENVGEQLQPWRKFPLKGDTSRYYFQTNDSKCYLLANV